MNKFSLLMSPLRNLLEFKLFLTKILPTKYDLKKSLKLFPWIWDGTCIATFNAWSCQKVCIKLLSFTKKLVFRHIIHFLIQCDPVRSLKYIQSKILILESSCYSWKIYISATIGIRCPHKVEFEMKFVGINIKL